MMPLKDRVGQTNHHNTFDRPCIGSDSGVHSCCDDHDVCDGGFCKTGILPLLTTGVPELFHSITGRQLYLVYAVVDSYFKYTEQLEIVIEPK